MSKDTHKHTHTWPQDMKAYVQLPLAAADKQSRVEVNRTMTDKVREERRRVQGVRVPREMDMRAMPFWGYDCDVILMKIDSGFLAQVKSK